MPTLFISYKRGTASVNPLMERLKAEHYRLWYDKDDIHTGENWREAINRGVDNSDALIACLSPAACESIYVQYEVQRALEQGKLIFPVQLERINPDGDLKTLGLPDIQYTDFTGAEIDTWDKAFDKLLDDMQRHDSLRLTQDVLQRTRGTAEHERHQRYLVKVAERVGRLNLANIAPEQGGLVNLEDVYIDSPTSLSISVEVQNWHVIDWWIPTSFRFNDGRKFDDGHRFDKDIHQQPEDLGYERPSLEALVGELEDEIEQYRRDNPDAKPDGEQSWHNKWNNGTKENAIGLQVQDIAAARSRLVILGEPGSGKSTFVRHLALCLAGQQIESWSRDVNLSHLRHWVHGELTPIYIELRRFVASKYFPADIQTQPTADDLWNYIQHEVLGADNQAYLADLKGDVRDGRALIIFDGLDEVGYPEGQLQARQTQMQSLAAIVNGAQFEKSRVIVASRPYAYEGWTLPDFQAVTITDFDDTHRLELATRLYKTSGMTADAAKEKAQGLNQQLGRVVPSLKDRPLFMTMMAQVYLAGEGEGLPTRLGALYRECILLLLERWTQGKADAPTLTEILGNATVDDLYNRLGMLAYEVHGEYGDQPGEPEIDEYLIYKNLKALGRTTAAELIPYLSENAGVLVSPGQDDERDVFRFAHRTFQEYLAAVHIVNQCMDADSYQQVRDLITTKEQIWRVPCQYVGDVLADTDRRSELWGLLGDLLEDDPPTDTIGTEMGDYDPRWWSAWLASQILMQQEMHKDTLKRRQEFTKSVLVEWLVALVETPFALEPPERADCGKALGLLGDERPGVGLRADGLPDMAWCAVPAGTFLMGSDKDNDSQAMDREMPQQEVELPAYKIAKYPVTVQQYRAFMAAGGYDKRDYWTDAGWDWKTSKNITQPRYWDDDEYNGDNQPVNGVSWYEAYAFCAWLNEQYHAKGILAENERLRLPTESEWEKAARGTDGRIYPYGDAYDPAKGNGGDTGIGTTSAVGIFPSGASPYGVLDMSGNVYDWCMSKWRMNYDIAEDNAAAGSDRRVVRGGSFAGNYTNILRAAYRYFNTPSRLSSSIGVRCCVCVVPVR